MPFKRIVKRETENDSIVLLSELAGLGLALALFLPLRNWLGLGDLLPANFRIPLAWHALIAISWLAALLLPRPTKRSSLKFVFAASIAAAVAWFTSGLMLVVTSRSLILVLFACLLIFPVLLRYAEDLLAAHRAWLRGASEAFARLGANLYIKRLDLIIPALMMLALSLEFVSEGMGYSPDSAEFTLAGAYLRYPGGAALDPSWPPLFPFLIALFATFAQFPAQAAEWVVLVSALSIVLAFAALLRLSSKNFWLNILLAAIFLSLDAWFLLGRMVWSELPFVTLSLASIFFSARAYESGSRLLWICAFALASLASLTRYIGVVLPLAILVTIWFQDSKTFRRSWKLAALSLMPLLVYLARNWVLFGTFAGERIASPTALTENAHIALIVLAEDLPLPFLLVLSAALLVLFWRRPRSNPPQRFLRVLLPAFTILYLVFLLSSASRYQIDPLSTRFLFPLYPIFIIFVASLWSSLSDGRLWFGGNQYWSRFAPLVLFGLLLVTLAQQLLHAQARWVSLANLHGRELPHYQRGYALSSTANLLPNELAEILKTNEIERVYLQFAQERLAPIFFLQPYPFADLDFDEVHFKFSDEKLNVSLLGEDGMSFESYALPDFESSSLLPECIDQDRSNGSFLIIYSADSRALLNASELQTYFEGRFLARTVPVPPYVLILFSPIGAAQ